MTPDSESRGRLVDEHVPVLPIQAAEPPIGLPADPLELAHELALHQLELEQQNQDLRSAQSAVEESRNRYANLYDFAPVAYFTLDLSGCIRQLNLPAANLLGTDRQRLIDLPFLSVARVTEPGIFWQHIRSCVATRAAVTSEFAFATTRTSLIQVQATSVPELDAKGDVVALRTALSDVSAQRRAQIERDEALNAERALRAQGARVDAAMVLVTQALTELEGRGSLPHVLQVVVDQARHVLCADYAAFALAEDSQLGVGPWILSASDDAALASIGAIAQQRGLGGGMTRRNATSRLADLRSPPDVAGMHGDHSAVEGVFGLPVRRRERLLGVLYFGKKRDGSAYDSSDRRVGERFAERVAITIEIAKLQDTARAGIEARDHLLAIVSHDLRNPLSVIALNTELLLREAGGNSDSGEPLHMIKSAAARMSRLIQDLLQVATLEAGEFSVNPRAEDLLALLQEAVASQQPIAAAKAISLVAELPAYLPAARCDRQRVLQVLANLIGNAVKFTSTGGSIRLAVAQREDELCISLADDGSGVEPSELPKLFERYWKGKGQRDGGTGLGLSIVKGIVELHGGEVWAESGVGKGTTFFFTLPMAKTAADGAGAAALAVPEPTAFLQGKRVLLVDDEGAAVKALRKMLELEGLVAFGCESGSEALQIFGSTALDALVLDMEMPQINGLTLLKRMRAEQPHIPAVIMSGYTLEHADVKEALAMGSVDYVAKPVDVDVLLEALTRVLGPARAMLD